jgi:hypothetical protein
LRPRPIGRYRTRRPRSKLRIRVRDLELLAEVVAHFEHSGFAVRVGGEVGVLDVRRPAPSPEQEQRELDARVSDWEAIHPGDYLELLDKAAPGG